MKATRAYAINRFVLSLVRGLMDQPDAVMTAFVRSNVLPHCKYFATQLQFGPEGVKLNFGIPKITSYELELLECSVAVLTKDIEIAEDAAKTFENTTRKRRSISRCGKNKAQKPPVETEK